MKRFLNLVSTHSIQCSKLVNEGGDVIVQNFEDGSTRVLCEHAESEMKVCKIDIANPCPYLVKRFQNQFEKVISSEEE